MREIKFRAWDSEYSIMFDSGVFIEADGAIYESAKRTYDTPNTEIALVNFPVMQFTELQDKNGVDIYEGDIVGKSSDKFCAKGVVSYHHGAWMVMEAIDRYFGLYFYLYECQVIGNIYENPEMIDKAGVLEL